MNRFTPVPLAMRAVLAAASVDLGAAVAAGPNIVYVIADDLGYGDVQCLNPQRGRIPTPNIDRLAREGMTFTDAHGGSSVCTPTRYGVLTGRYAWRTRLQKGVLSGYDEPLIAPGRLTVPALLKQHGYHSACVGKWHLGFTVSDKGAGRRTKGDLAGAFLGARTEDGPVSRGFDHFYGFHHARMMKSVFLDDRVAELVEPVDMLPKLARHAAEYILRTSNTEHRTSNTEGRSDPTSNTQQPTPNTQSSGTAGGQPFFLYLALNSPHTPIVPSREWQGKSGLGDYGDFVMETDWAVGEVLAALDRAGVASSTLVIFTSDNGSSPAAGMDKLETQGHYPSAQFRGAKADIWDGGHRIPFIVRWPGIVAAGSTNGGLVCLTDLLATCAEIVGATLPGNAGEDSVSLLPALRGGRNAEPSFAKAAEGRHRTADATSNNQRPIPNLQPGTRNPERGTTATPPHSHTATPPNGHTATHPDAPPAPGARPPVVHHSINGFFAIRDGRWKLCLCAGSGGWSQGGGAESPQLYDMAADEAETNNVAAAHPEIVARLTSDLERIVAEGRSTPGPRQPNDGAVDILKTGAKGRRKS
jgi:arylsulfatase A-like enzyme